MSVQCIDCQYFSLREAGQMARQGFGHCALDANKAMYQSAVFERQCAKFLAADEDTCAKRRAWLEWEKKRFFEGLLP